MVHFCKQEEVSFDKTKPYILFILGSVLVEFGYTLKVFLVVHEGAALANWHLDIFWQKRSFIARELENISGNKLYMVIVFVIITSHYFMTSTFRSSLAAPLFHKCFIVFCHFFVFHNNTLPSP